MIQVYRFNFGDYTQKIIMDEKKIKDTECNCIYGQINKDMWKNSDKKPCKHIVSALMHLELRIKSGRKIYK